ncbi:unnamed protein product [Rotaria sp. Silwood1]|nr:unnamed protein product [Rotaria sp. Silwood1]
MEQDIWKQEMKAFLHKVKKIPLNKRYYYDQSVLYSAPQLKKRVKVQKGGHLIRYVKSKETRYILHACIGITGPIAFEVTKKNLNDHEVKRFIVRKIVPKLKLDDALVMDRLGSTRRVKNPRKQHFNPLMLAAVKDVGADVLHLPFKGSYLNPIELLFSDLKNNFPVKKYSHYPNNEMNISSIAKHVQQYMNYVAPQRCRGFYRNRANGKSIINCGLLD